MMKTEVADPLTLFSPGTPDAGISESDPPYSVAIQLLEKSEAARFPDSELSVFAHVLEHEVALYERRGSLAGPMAIRIGDTVPVDVVAHLNCPVSAQVNCPATWKEEDGFLLPSSDLWI